MLPAVKAVWRNPYVRVLVGLVGLFLLYLFLDWSRAVWGSLLAAYLIAFIFNPIVSWCERWVNRLVGVLAIALGLVGALVGIWFLGIQIAAQLSVFLEDLPQLVEQVEELPYLAARWIDPGFGNTFQQVFQSLTAAAQGITTELVPPLEAARGGLVERLTVVTSGGFQVTIVVVLSVYLLYNFPVYNRSFMRAFPERYRPAVAEVVDRLSTATGGYIRGQLLIALTVGVLSTVVLLLVRVPLAIALGVIAGVGNLIPFVGPLLATVPAFVLAIPNGWLTALLAVGGLLAIQLLDANVLTPIVYSRVISLDPVTVLLALLTGSLLFGLWGALAAVPVAVFLTLLYRDYYLESAWYRGEPAEQPAIEASPAAPPRVEPPTVEGARADPPAGRPAELER